MTEPTVLYVPGEGRSGDATAAALDATELHVIVADGPLDAVVHLHDETPDCVVLSLPLGDIGADRLVRELRPEQADVPILLLGGDDTAVATALAEGATGRVRRENVDRIVDRVREVAVDRVIDRSIERQQELEEHVLSVLTALPGTTNRSEVERLVYEQLSTVDRYSTALLGTYDEDTQVVRTEFPVAGEFAPAARDGSVSAGSFLDRAVASGRVTTSDCDLGPAEWITGSDESETVGDDGHALVTLAVPFAHEGTTHGVLLLGTDRIRTPGSAERSVLGDLGTAVGRELDRASGRVEAAGDDEVRRFAEGFAHELRNALAIASTQFELGRDGDEDALDRARDTIEELERTVDGMLSLAAGVEETTVRDLRDDVDDAWATVEPTDAELVVENSETIEADHDLVVRLLSNLFGNAVEHGSSTRSSDSDGAPSVTIRVGTTESGFYVEDDGSGVPADERDQIFEWGYSTNVGGIGIGLAVVDAIAEAHGWSVKATDARDGGARFEVTGVRRPSD